MRFLRRNVLWVYAVFGGALISGLIVPPILLHSLGDTELGIWLFIGSITGYLRVLDFGVGPSIVRFGAKHRGEKDEEATNALASVGLAVYAIIGSAATLAGVVLAFVVPLLIDVPAGLVWEVRVATLLVVAGIVVDFLIGIFTDLLGAQQRNDVVNFAGFVSVLLYAALVVAILTHSGGIVELSAIVLVITVVRLAIPILWVPRELPYLHPRRRYVTRARIRELLGFSWHNFLIHVATRASYGTDIIVVALVLGATSTTVFGLPGKLVGMAAALALAVPNLLYPAVAEAEGAGDAGRHRWYLRGGLRLGMTFVLLVALPLILIPHDCLLAWGIGTGKNRLTPHQLDEASLVLSLLGITALLGQPLTIATRYMIARGRPAEVARILLLVVAVNVTVSVVLAETVGLWGVAVGTIVGQVVALAMLPPRVARSSGLSLRRLATATMRPVLPAAVAGVIFFGIVRTFHPETKVELAPVGVVWVVVCSAAVWFFGLATEDRRAILRNIGSRVTPPEMPAAPASSDPLE